MGAMASRITSLTIVYSSVYSGADQRKHQSSASLAFVRGIHRSPVTRKMFPFDDVIMNVSPGEFDFCIGTYSFPCASSNSDGRRKLPRWAKYVPSWCQRCLTSFLVRLRNRWWKLPCRKFCTVASLVVNTIEVPRSSKWHPRRHANHSLYHFHHMLILLTPENWYPVISSH